MAVESNHSAECDLYEKKYFHFRCSLSLGFSIFRGIYKGIQLTENLYAQIEGFLEGLQTRSIARDFRYST